jgi:hypothetical protein
MHEPVIVALICPLLHCRPWQIRHTPLVAQLQDQMSGMWSSDLARERSGLRNFWKERANSLTCNGAWHGACYKQDPKDPFMVLRAWDLEDSIMGPEELEEDDPDRFKCARNGDHLMCPFKCDLC